MKKLTFNKDGLTPYVLYSDLYPTEKNSPYKLVDKYFRKVSKQTFDKLTGEDISYTVGSLEDINNDIYEIELNGFSYDIVDHIKCNGVYAIITE